VKGADPTCVFRVDSGLIEALERAFGPPVDSYLSGWQVWLEGAGEDIELEYRLHPPGGFRVPEGLHPEELWDRVTGQLAEGRERLRLGDRELSLEDVWALLEVYPAFGDPLTPEELRVLSETVLGRPALAAGYVDHRRLGKHWERGRGHFDLPAALLEELAGG
jgi:hypothetical protein